MVFHAKVHLLEIISLNPFNYKVIDIYSENSELTNEVTLFYVLSKGKKNELVIQKATELGVSHIVLLSSSRSVIKLNQDDFNHKKERLEMIVKEASEQSKRQQIPSIDGIYDISDIPQHLLCHTNLVAYELSNYSLNDTFNLLCNIKEGESVSLLIGPEGGISPQEIEILKKQGFQDISLGKRILRTETAAIYTLSILAFMLER